MKSLAKNSVYNIIYKCINVAFPLVTAAYISRILLAVGVGKVASAQNIVQYFTILAALGLPIYGTKAIAAVADKKDEQSKTFIELFTINVASTVVCIVLYYAMISLIPYFQSRWLLFAVTGLSIVFNIINIDWFYQGKEEYRYIMLRSMVVKVLSLVAVFLFVKTINDFIIYAAITTLANGANYIFNIIHIRKYVHFSFKNISIGKHLKPVLILLAGSMAIEIYTLADTTMLTFVHGDTIVGYYSTAFKSISIVRTLVTAICAVFLPRLSYYYSNNQVEMFESLVNKGIRILAFIALPASIGLALIAGDMVMVLYGSSFNEAVATTQILALSVITVAFSNFFGYQVLVTIGKEKRMFISTIVGAVTNIVLNFALIFTLKHNGAAIASVVTELLVAVYQAVVIRNVVRLNINMKYLSTLAIGSLIMVIVVIVCRLTIDNLYARLLVSVMLGGCSYFAGTLAYKNELATETADKIRKLLLRK